MTDQTRIGRSTDNPVLQDVRVYLKQRALMVQPKGWHHVNLVFLEALAANPWGATWKQIEDASYLLRRLADIERSLNQRTFLSGRDRDELKDEIRRAENLMVALNENGDKSAAHFALHQMTKLVTRVVRGRES